jgi:beta-N-acetylhexosaminidase
VTLIRTVQAASKVPLFVAVDEEGGRVSRLTESGRMHAVHMPAPAEVGAAGDPKLAYREGRYVGSELLSLGINMDLAPVADVDTNPRNRVIGTRSFSSDPQVAARMTGAMVRGLQSMGVSSVIKHFPGHGDTTTDSHLGTAVVHHTLGRLEKVEFVPFRAGISAGADGVLIGHLLLPEILEQKDIPATFSPYILEVLLRKQLDFKKLIITDALNMRAIVDYWSSGTAAIDAFQAGADMLLMPADARTAYTAILEAVKSGEITEKRLDQSIRRILMIKIERQIIGPARILPNPHQVFGSIEGKRILAAIQTEAAKNAGKSSKQ